MSQTDVGLSYDKRKGKVRKKKNKETAPGTLHSKVTHAHVLFRLCLLLSVAISRTDYNFPP